MELFQHSQANRKLANLCFCDSTNSKSTSSLVPYYIPGLRGKNPCTTRHQLVFDRVRHPAIHRAIHPSIHPCDEPLAEQLSRFILKSRFAFLIPHPDTLFMVWKCMYYLQAQDVTRKSVNNMIALWCGLCHKVRKQMAQIGTFHSQHSNCVWRGGRNFRSNGFKSTEGLPVNQPAS